MIGRLSGLLRIAGLALLALGLMTCGDSIGVPGSRQAQFSILLDYGDDRVVGIIDVNSMHVIVSRKADDVVFEGTCPITLSGSDRMQRCSLQG